MTGQRLLLIGLLMGIFLAAIDSTVVGVALPSIVSSLKGLNIYSWAFTAYILTSTVTGPLWGKLSDIYGRRFIYVAGVLIFLAGSLLCGLAQDMVQLVVFRGIQGLGGGALLVLTFTIVGEIFTLKERAKATGYTSSVWAIASIVGPPLGGFIVDTVGWRWIFLINLPVGLFCVATVGRILTTNTRTETKIDVSGSILFLVAASALLLYLSEFQNIGDTAPLILLTSGAAFTLFFYNERRSPSPLIPFHLFREKILRTGFLGNLLAGFVFFGIIAYMPLYLQTVLGYSATFSGVLLLPLVLGWVASANAAAMLAIRASLKIPAMLSGVFLVCGTVSLSLASQNMPILLTGLGLTGLGMGFTVSTFLIATQTVVPRGVLGVATSLLSFLRLMGGAVSAAVLWLPIGALVKDLGLQESVGVVLSEAEKRAFTAGFSQSLAIAVAASAVALILYLFTPSIKLAKLGDKSS
ncbi:MAG: MFS transporter [Aigarchaeota archaeon]|nr:MFS transporter [Candidatus Caldarchaeales archaeon]MDJ0273483.1 MFS transporter [Candidatus Caldarchaeales archaeon]